MIKELKFSAVLTGIILIPAIVYLSMINTRLYDIVIISLTIFFLVAYFVSRYNFNKIKKSDNLKSVNDEYLSYIQNVIEVLMLVGVVVGFLSVATGDEISTSMLVSATMLHFYRLLNLGIVYIGDNKLYVSGECFDIKDIQNSKKEEIQTKALIHNQKTKYNIKIKGYKRDIQFTLSNLAVSKANQDNLDKAILR